MFRDAFKSFIFTLAEKHKAIHHRPKFKACFYSILEFSNSSKNLDAEKAYIVLEEITFSTKAQNVDKRDRQNELGILFLKKISSRNEGNEGEFELISELQALADDFEAKILEAYGNRNSLFLGLNVGSFRGTPIVETAMMGIPPDYRGFLLNFDIAKNINLSVNPDKWFE